MIGQKFCLTPGRFRTMSVVHILLGAIWEFYSCNTKKNWNNTFYWETKQCLSICKFKHSPNHTFLHKMLSRSSMIFSRTK